MAITPGAARAAARSIETMRPLGMAEPHIAIGLVRHHVMAVVGIGRGAGSLERAVDAVHGQADDL
jgi:hypothetical protein